VRLWAKGRGLARAQRKMDLNPAVIAMALYCLMWAVGQPGPSSSL
jgi:hypothetical protein